MKCFTDAISGAPGSELRTLSPSESWIPRVRPLLKPGLCPVTYTGSPVYHCFQARILPANRFHASHRTHHQPLCGNVPKHRHHSRLSADLHIDQVQKWENWLYFSILYSLLLKIGITEILALSSIYKLYIYVYNIENRPVSTTFFPVSNCIHNLS